MTRTSARPTSCILAPTEAKRHLKPYRSSSPALQKLGATHANSVSLRHHFRFSYPFSKTFSPFLLFSCLLPHLLFSNMASKLLNYCHLQALCSRHVFSPRLPHPTRAALTLLHFRPFSDAPSSPPPEKPHSYNNTRNDIGMEKGPIQTPSSLKELELVKFASIAETWWDPEGPFKPLHVMNPTRLAFIRSTLCRHFRKDPNSSRPFEGLKIVDVGCGGGILSEPLARMGAAVMGVDAVEKNIKIARLHADLDPVTSTIEYCCTTAERLVEEERKFDAVISLEVIEHVADPAEFCKSLAALTIPDGATVISTINRSMRAYATAIIGAEYILHWLPKGTHQWSSFLTPEELVLILERANITVKEMAGFVYNPFTRRWSLSDDISVNFISFGTKKVQ